MNIQDIKTRFTKGNRAEVGDLLSMEEETGEVKLRSKIVAVGAGRGKLELFKKKDDGSADEEALLLEHEEAMSSHEVCQYMMPYTDQVEELKLALEDDRAVEEKVGEESGELERDESASAKSLAFARMDYDLVHKEIMNIKGCRANLFMGSLGVLGAVGVAILGIFGSTGSVSVVSIGHLPIVGVTKVAAWESWLPWATVVPVGMLISAILATIHKARKVNMRRGYMESLGEYLAEGILPPHCGGWPKAILVIERCGIYLGLIAEKGARKHKSQLNEAAGQNEMSGKAQIVRRCEVYKKVKEKPRQKGYLSRCWERVAALFGYRKRKEARCLDAGKMGAEEVSGGIRFWAPPLHSFTSLSTYIYGAAFLLSVGALLLSLMNALENYVPRDFSRKTFVIVSVSSGFLTLVFAIMSTIIKLSRSGKVSGGGGRRKSLADRAFRVCGYLGMVCLGLGLIGLIYGMTYRRSHSESVMFAYILGATITIVGIFAANAFYEKVHAVRRGRHSLERWRHIWKLCFQYCPLMDDETPYDLPEQAAQ